MKTIAPKALVMALSLALSAAAGAAVISNVVETGGDNKATDTIQAKWSGQTWSVTIANEPVIGLAVGNSYTAGTFGSAAPAFVDRAHRYLDDPGTGGFPAQAIPSYLVGMEYVMSGNDNRDNTTYRLDIELSSAARIFMLVDNRLGDTANNTPPTFDATHMQWMVTDGWLPTANGLNRFASTAVPDEVPIDEGADNTINQYYSVYYKDFPAGVASLLQADNAGQNMYGVVVMGIPEPATAGLGGIAAAGLLLRRRRR